MSLRVRVFQVLRLMLIAIPILSLAPGAMTAGVGVDMFLKSTTMVGLVKGVIIGLSGGIFMAGLFFSGLYFADKIDARLARFETTACLQDPKY